MPVYRYVAMDRDRRKTSGTVEAADKVDAIRGIEKLGLSPMSIADEGAGGEPRFTGNSDARKPVRDDFRGLVTGPASLCAVGRSILTRCTEVVVEWVAEHEHRLRRALVAIGVMLVLNRWHRAFPVIEPFLALWISLGLVGLTVVSLRLGLLATLAALFFPVAYHAPLLGHFYAVGAFCLFFMFGVSRPGQAVLLLLTPLLLRWNIGYALPLGAGILCGTTSGAFFGAAVAFTGLAGMLAGDIHQLGPLVINHSHTPILRTAITEMPAFFSTSWLASLSGEVRHAFSGFRSATFPALLKPPVAIVQIAGWATAGYLSGKFGFCPKRDIRRLAAGLAVGACALLLTSGLTERLPGNSCTVPWSASAKSLLAGAVIVSLIVCLRQRQAEADGEESSPSRETGWDAIGGLEDVKQEIRMAVRYQFDKRSARMARRYGLRKVRGILFYGPPGCGKTLFARAMAKEVKASFFSIKGSDFRSKWYGESETNLNKIFGRARDKAPAIIFIDEIENMLGKRTETMTSDSPEKRIVAMFLSEMDGISDLGDVLVVGATNEPDLIDPAVLRPGRFDKLIYIPLPDERGREQIIGVHLRDKPTSDDLDLHELAAMTERFSGADLADLCTKAAEQALHESMESGSFKKITMHAIRTRITITKPSVSLKLLRKYDELQEKYNRRAIRADTDKPERTEDYGWDQVGGLDAVKQELTEAVEMPLTKPELYDRFNIKPPKGALLYGPPGCGKTLMAKIVASRCQAHFLSVDIKKESAEGIRDWFIRARENRPCILFFDEIDSIGMSREAGPTAGQSLVTQLLVELDGIEDLKQVVVIAATNRPDHLDAALLRPGRLDRLVYVPPPTEAGRLDILRIHLAGKPVAVDVDLADIAARTADYTGADLTALCYEASMNLIRRAGDGESMITAGDFSDALGKIGLSLSAEDLDYYSRMKAKYSRSAA